MVPSRTRRPNPDILPSTLAEEGRHLSYLRGGAAMEAWGNGGRGRRRKRKEEGEEWGGRGRRCSPMFRPGILPCSACSYPQPVRYIARHTTLSSHYTQQCTQHTTLQLYGCKRSVVSASSPAMPPSPSLPPLFLPPSLSLSLSLFRRLSLSPADSRCDLHGAAPVQ